MKEWKIRQEFYHRTNKMTDFIDGTEAIVPVDERGIVRFIVTITEYFTHEQKQIVQPLKSFAVAIVYAKLLEKYFNEDFYRALSDPHLLFGNDKHFVPYQKNKLVYDIVVLALQRKGLFDNLENINLPHVQTTIRYFKQEFLLS